MSPSEINSKASDLDPTFHFDEDLDLDPACNIDADPNPTYHFDADPDAEPDPTFQFDADPCGSGFSKLLVAQLLGTRDI